MQALDRQTKLTFQRPLKAKACISVVYMKAKSTSYNQAHDYNGVAHMA